MFYTELTDKDAVLLVRALGLLVSQASVYGSSHRVTQSAARSVFAELDQTLKTYGPVEIALKDDRVLLNGSLNGLDESIGKNLFDRMALHKIGGLVFLPPADLSEFLTCITLFGTPPATLEAQGGFEAALKRSGVRSVRAVTVAYQRVTGPSVPAPVSEPPAAPAVRRRPVSSDSLVDLATAWERDFGGLAADPEESSPHLPPVSACQERAARLAALLRDTATLLEQDSALSTEEQHRRVLSAVARIREALTASAEESQRQIAALADQVDADSQTVASIESAARRRGIGIKLTRAELIERYAELNQEIVQPLTVSTGVIDMLHTGRAGPLTESQQDMLKLAAESVDRVNQLVAYMRRIAGLPDTYTPDADIISETYR